MKRASLIGQRVVILGAGREGLATYEALLPILGPETLQIWAESGPASVEQVGALPIKTAIQTGPFDERLADFDVAIRSPGIQVDHPALMAYRARGGRVVSPSSIYLAERPDVPIIGVTGSKGKSTTSSILAHLLQAQGRSVLLAGNIGKPLIGCLETKSDVVVAELSSYQLSDLEGALSLGVITRLFPEHVDWHGSVASYYGAKKRLFDLVAGQPVLINQRDLNLVEESADRPNRVLVNPPEAQATSELHRRGNTIYHQGQPIFDSSQWALRGHHNIDNAMMALAVVEQWGDQISQAVTRLGQFQALAHRLSPVAGPQLHDVAIGWVNDSIATTPHATKAALEAFGDQPLVLMVGGYERGGDWAVVIDHLRNHPLLGLVALPDNGAAIAERLLGAQVIGDAQIAYAEDLDQGIEKALDLIRQQANQCSLSGCAVLLSPGAPSFGRYRDFEHRGQSFVDALIARSKSAQRSR